MCKQCRLLYVDTVKSQFHQSEEPVQVDTASNLILFQSQNSYHPMKKRRVYVIVPYFGIEKFS